jgi:hypothetical protein
MPICTHHQRHTHSAHTVLLAAAHAEANATTKLIGSPYGLPAQANMGALLYSAHWGQALFVLICSVGDVPRGSALACASWAGAARNQRVAWTVKPERTTGLDHRQ